MCHSSTQHSLKASRLIHSKIQSSSVPDKAMSRLLSLLPHCLYFLSHFFSHTGLVLSHASQAEPSRNLHSCCFCYLECPFTKYLRDLLLYFFFFFDRLLLKGSFRFLAKLSRRYRFLSHLPSSPICA